jgi:hypothetical protein
MTKMKEIESTVRLYDHAPGMTQLIDSGGHLVQGSDLVARICGWLDLRFPDQP